MTITHELEGSDDRHLLGRRSTCGTKTTSLADTGSTPQKILEVCQPATKSLSKLGHTESYLANPIEGPG